MLLIDLEQCDYANKTVAIKRLLRSFDMNWKELFQSSHDSVPFDGPLHRHFKCLEDFSDSHWFRYPTIHLIQGDWEFGRKLRDALVMSDKVPLWRNSLTYIARKSELRMADQFRCLIKPPIWHHPGVLHVLNPLLADRSLIPEFLAGDQRNFAWDLMCDVEQFAHDALLFELANEKEQADNPFEKLIAIYRVGAFPIDFNNGEFFVFTP